MTMTYTNLGEIYGFIPISDHFLGFLGLIFFPETTLEKALNINDIFNFLSVLSEQNLCPKNPRK